MGKSKTRSKLRSIFLFALIFLSLQVHAQVISIQPYLQNAEPHSIDILWEADFQDTSYVEWGPTDSLGNVNVAFDTLLNGTHHLYSSRIEGLKRFTDYCYRVRTGTQVSEIFKFKTPPYAADEKPFSLIAMSDMQRDGAFPDKFQEIVEEGVLAFFDSEMGGHISENVALLMVPGDLVVNGNNFNSWRREFFNPVAQLSSSVPVYPVLGNHENNSTYYFRYFNLPTNGTEGFEEHWWFKDYSNVRIIGLNSNGSFAGSEQLAWLDTTLENTCAADSVDFVFAQLHHPHKSELWTPGESGFTGQVIERLEKFSSDCNKPSIHFFGHTHGYSRGQSRDHKHLWVNVASAGGAIDNWGEFPNFDYDEFSVSQDEYGFVVVDVLAGSEPEVKLRRISRGDQDEVLNNVIRDSLTITVKDKLVAQPKALYPIGSVSLPPECVELKSSPFQGLEMSDEHGQSHWQIADVELGFGDPIFESWKNHENWYYDVDTQAEDDLTDELATGLEELNTYMWRVRYRDKEFNWSTWSDSVVFSTGLSIAPENLIINHGGEDDIDSWTVDEGVFESLTAGECNGVNPYIGSRYFSVGGLCEHSAFARVSQLIDVSPYRDSILTGGFQFNFGGYLSNYSGSDRPSMKCIFLDEQSNELAETANLSTTSNRWTYLNAEGYLPEKTHYIRIELTGTRNAGTDNDSYFDALFFNVGSTEKACDRITSVDRLPHFSVAPLKAFPNPTSSELIVELPYDIGEDYLIHLTNAAGVKCHVESQFLEGRLQLGLSHLPEGLYVLGLRTRSNKLYTAKIMVQK